MSLTMRQRMLLHMIVQRFDRTSNSASLERASASAELGTDVEEVSRDLDVLEEQGYVARVTDPAEPEATEGVGTRWVVTPTDRGVMSAMGLE